MDWVKVTDNRVALEKQLLSYLKSKWVFSDYPLKTWEVPSAKEKNLMYQAGIINWTMMLEAGATREQAVANLKNKFELYRVNNQRLPRPGTAVPIKIQFASIEEIKKYSDIQQDFINRILHDFIKGILFMSDDSSLNDYEPDDSEQASRQRDAIISRVLSIYGIDITELYEGPLYKIFELMRNKRNGIQSAKQL